MKQENKFVLSEKWSVSVNEENKNILNDWRDSELFSSYGFINQDGLWMPELMYFNDDAVEITFDQFKEHVLKEIPKPEYDPKDVAFKIVPVSALTIVDDNVSINPKFLGYKIINDEFRIAIIKILEMDSLEYFKQDQKIDFYPNSEIEKALISLGVLSTWCKLIYDNSITLKSGVKLSEDDIAEVKEILNTGNRNNNLI